MISSLRRWTQTKSDELPAPLQLNKTNGRLENQYCCLISTTTDTIQIIGGGVNYDNLYEMLIDVLNYDRCHTTTVIIVSNLCNLWNPIDYYSISLPIEFVRPQ